MKITIISFDNWGFNNHIAAALKDEGHCCTSHKFQYFHL